MKPYDPQDERQDRYEEIVAQRAAGDSYRTIGKRYGISHERVRQILAGGPPGLAGWLGHSARNEPQSSP